MCSGCKSPLSVVLPVFSAQINYMHWYHCATPLSALQALVALLYSFSTCKGKCEFECTEHRLVSGLCKRNPLLRCSGVLCICSSDPLCWCCIVSNITARSDSRSDYIYSETSDTCNRGKEESGLLLALGRVCSKNHNCLHQQKQCSLSLSPASNLESQPSVKTTT